MKLLPAKPMNLQTYLQHRRTFEILLWLAFVVATLIANILVIAIDLDQTSSGTTLREVIVWETSSIFVVFCLIPVIVKFNSITPLRWSTFPQSTLLHIVYSIVFSLIHVAAMVGIRKLVYSLNGSTYEFGSIPVGLFYEYLKDGRTYFLIIGLSYLYQFMLLRLQGEASVLSSEDGKAEENNALSVERLLVKKLGKEFLIHTKDIDYAEAAGNYVNIHIGDRIYPLRSTMTKICQQLNKEHFRRIHRSYLVNVNKINEIQPLESGDATIKLKTNREIPVSRTYRAELSA